MKSFQFIAVAPAILALVTAADNPYATYPSVAKTATINGFADKIYDQLAPCARECVKQDTGSTPCPYWDTGCLCVMPQFAGPIADCIAKNCKGSDVAGATELATSLCSSAGVWEPYWMVPESGKAALSSAANVADTPATTTKEEEASTEAPAKTSEEQAPQTTEEQAPQTTEQAEQTTEAEKPEAEQTTEAEKPESEQTTEAPKPEAEGTTEAEGASEKTVETAEASSSKSEDSQESAAPTVSPELNGANNQLPGLVGSLGVVGLMAVIF
ncbi:uncharacterized protein SPAPADRAFT_62500 [Spathaspora passalidarum NRRL Y-27907]|uniref:CFEM domain-containing protein n=1 Tax=Spathaspora passalidarum (strain NRRL Y-27907 / 11-Y1) TaxID=619300 RepID=G3ASA0_SPAPN|nr:uncharacterized protein SPAPADRAFT_62500 [Spathaspora passalidarum NRRL Y-27907]EGW30640.1 hypothetical protein SPAPADRAFT_62500 [Spathaspora passalidarum NRRL Y-27907]